MIYIKNMIFSVALGLFISIFTLPAEDLTVDKDELSSVNKGGVNFINYVGPYEFINSLDQIRSIGRSLGVQIEKTKTGKANVGVKYSILHIISPEIPEGFDSDVFILNENAAVDHIVNLRHIIAGYIETAYDVTAQDAYLIAEFVTYYNAAYRGKMETLSQKYKLPVIDVLDPEKAGLDTHYSNWPGLTQMLIPLRTGARKVDTGAITDEEVINLMRNETGQGLESREDMVYLREEELDKEQAALDKRKEELVKKLEDIDNMTDEKRRALEEERTAIEKEQEEIDTRTEEVMVMRDEIARDKNDAMVNANRETFTSADKITPVWFLTVDSNKDGIPFGRVVKYNLDNGKRLAVSDITAVRGRTMVLLPDVLMVIAGKNDGTSTVRPVLLDIDTLKTQKEGKNDIFPGSLITVRGNNIYLVTTENGEWRLGKFNTSLERAAVSEVAVEPWTSISFDKTDLYVQGAHGEIIKLSAGTLKEQARITQ